MAEQRVQRRLAAILAADVVGYSRLMGEDETGTLAQIKTLRKEVFDPRTAEHNGRIVKTTGDGVLVEFTSAVDATECAIKIQRALTRRNEEVPEGQRIELRIGINLGDIIVDGDDIYGDGVNVAARLEALCDTGEVFVSAVVHDQVEGKIEADFKDLGERMVKNIDKPVGVYRVSSAVRPAVVTEVDKLFERPAVAVLPFENIGGDPDQEYFADGLTEDIITALSLWKSFPVIARNSTFAYKGQSPDIRKVGEELSAHYVVEGSIRKSGNKVRVTAQLINAHTGHHIWAERYDRELADIFALQDEITQQIASIIEPTIERTERQRISAKPPETLAAWEFSLKGYSYIYDETKVANEIARDMFNRAIELDPDYVRAYTGLSYTYSRDLRFFDPVDRAECLRLLFEAARRAVALDETDSDARSMLARGYMRAHQADSAVAEASRAVELNPNNARANEALGIALSLESDRYEEGIRYLERAIKLNPLAPQKHLWLTHVSMAHLCAGQIEKAIEYADEALRREPEFPEARVALASALGHMNNPREAQTAIKDFEDVARNWDERTVTWSQAVQDRLLDGLRKAGLLD